MSSSSLLPNQILLLNKPVMMLCQFSPHEGKNTLSDVIQLPEIYPAGRLDYDSEGLLLLTGNGRLQHQLSHPKFKLPKTYWVQVEGNISDSAIEQLSTGVSLKDGKTRPAQAKIMAPPPSLWKRNPPIRYRSDIPTSWLQLTITEGRNRQVRRMTAATGYPTLRLIRHAIGPWALDSLKPGEYRVETVPPELMPKADKTQQSKRPKKNLTQQKPRQPQKRSKYYQRSRDT